jgi:hypothetical protein
MNRIEKEWIIALILVVLGWTAVLLFDNNIPEAEVVDNSTEPQRSISLLTYEKFGDEWVEQYNVDFDYDNGTIFEWYCPDRNYKFILIGRAEHGRIKR